MMPEVSGLEEALRVRREESRAVVTVEEETLDVLIFEIDGVWWAFPGSFIREILPQVEVFFVPGCQPSLEGVINVRGDIETVINLGEVLGPKKQAYAPTWAILLGATEDLQSGIRVDKVIDVLTLPRSAVQAPPGSLDPSLGAVVTGVLLYQGVPVSVLSLERIFELYAQRLP